MQKVTLDEIVGLERYEKIRDDFRRRIIELKKHRRMPVGDRVTFVFENHETVRFQIQEMLRAEHITDIDKVRFEVAVYNELIPEDGELSATMLIEITEQAQIRPELVRLIGIDRVVSLQVGSHTIPGIFEGGRSTEDNLSAVQYVRFPLSAEARLAFRDEQQEVRLVIEHPNYHAHTVFSPETRRSLASDLWSLRPQVWRLAAREDMEQVIRQRTTQQLTVISAAIQGDHSHPSAEDIYRRVRKVLPHISLGTVYRNLQRLVQEGTLQVLFLGERVARYDPTLAEHDHFICQRCGRVEDVWMDRDRQVDFAPLVREGFTVAAHSLAIHGICQLCGPQRTPRRRPRRVALPVPTKRERMP